MLLLLLKVNAEIGFVESWLMYLVGLFGFCAKNIKHLFVVRIKNVIKMRLFAVVCCIYLKIA
jgi:hypothetical protein